MYLKHVYNSPTLIINDHSYIKSILIAKVIFKISMYVLSLTLTVSTDSILLTTSQKSELFSTNSIPFTTFNN